VAGSREDSSGPAWTGQSGHAPWLSGPQPPGWMAAGGPMPDRPGAGLPRPGARDRAQGGGPAGGDQPGAARPDTARPRAGRAGVAQRPTLNPRVPRGLAGGPPGHGPGRSYIATCVLAAVIMVASGFAYVTVRDVASIGSSNAILSGPSTGPQNILLMGIESRRYWNGTILPPSILAKLHAGSASAVAAGVGGNATNTLILIHVFADGKRAVGFSIPRDDWVHFADTIGPQQSGKIDQAYGVSMFYREEQLTQQNSGMSQDKIAVLGNEAGQAAAVATVEKLTGVHIDHFAAVNLYGFYELAQVLGGVEVCLNHPVNDVNSGANFPAGYQHLDAAQALAFVRQRDGLPNGDLDRTHRQQAFLDSVIHQLRTEGVLTDLTKVQALLNVARQYVITDSGWNLLDFAANARNLTNANLVFHTLPITGYETIDGQDANAVNPAYIRQIVHATFYPKPASRANPASSSAGTGTVDPHLTTVDVFNGARITDLAHRVSAALVSAGYTAGQVADTSDRATTAVLYGSGAQASASQIAALFHVTAVAGPSVPSGHVQVLLGAGATVPTITAVSKPGVSPATVVPTTGPQGGAVHAKNGIPCVN
jgi:LCP family protein required for cell wall assembly